MSLEESLRFIPRGGIAGGDTGGKMDPVRPSRGGLQWCAVPQETTGLAYICNASCELKALRIDALSEDPDEAPTELFQILIPALPLYCCTSADGRLVAVACGDGSLRCYNALSDKFTERWVLPNAHSYCLSSWQDIVSSARTCGAGASGPLRSMAFSGTQLLWVDDASYNENGKKGKGLQVVEAAVAETPSVVATLSTVASSCATWGLSGSRILIGTTEGQIVTVDYKNNKFEKLKKIKQLTTTR